MYDIRKMKKSQEIFNEILAIVPNADFAEIRQDERGNLGFRFILTQNLKKQK